MARSAQSKNEKQAIDAKITKVREVVRNVSNNDIVLALHNFEMDVERTIAAFMDGGVDNALGAWEKCGTVSNKKKKGGSSTNAPAENSAPSSTTTETPSVHAPVNANRSRKTPTTAAPAKGATVTAAPQPTATPAVQSTKKLSGNEKPDELRRLMQEADGNTAKLQQACDTALHEKSAVFSALAHALKAREQQIDQYLRKTRTEADNIAADQRLIFQRLQQNPSNDEMARFMANNEAVNAKLRQNFTLHSDKALKAIEKLGASFLPAAAATPEVGTFNGVPAQTAPQANGTPSAPVPDKQNGKPTAKPNNEKPKADVPAPKPANGVDIKHAISQSSLASSAGEDSGLGQVSPVYQVTEKVAAQVADSGILQSDGLSSDQLAALQALIQQNLEAQGINSDVLKGITGDADTTLVSTRRRPPTGGRRDDNSKSKQQQQNGKSHKPVKAGH